MDMEKAVATIIEEEGVLLMVVVVVGLQVTSTEVEETGGAGHLSRDRKGGTSKFLQFSNLFNNVHPFRHSRIEMSPMSRQ